PLHPPDSSVERRRPFHEPFRDAEHLLCRRLHPRGARHPTRGGNHRRLPGIRHEPSPLRMSHSTRAFLVMVAVALVTVLGDYFLKLAASSLTLRAKPLVAGIVIYGSTAFAWVYAMRHLKLATLSVVFTISMLLFA